MQRLLIITPFKNEADSIGKTIDSIVKQTSYPVKWLMIDDSSDDSSPEIVKSFQEKYDFIEYHRREKTENTRATGSNIVSLFNYGLALAESLNIEWDIVAKLDADLVIQQDSYLSFLMEKFTKYPKLGIASGVTFVLNGADKVIESKHKWHTQGPNKFYRKACLAAIGGLKPFKGWDGIDDMLARDKGFITEKFFEQEVLHLYPTQTRTTEGGIKMGLKREAGGYRNMSYPLYMCLLRAVKIAKKHSLHSGLLFFYYCVLNFMNTKPLLNKSERKVVSRFMRKRLRNNFKYTAAKGMRVLAIASAGGHWVQLLRLAPAFKNQELSFMSTNPNFSIMVENYQFFTVPDANKNNKLNLIRCFLQVFRIVLVKRPDIIITTGAAPGLMGIIVGRFTGAKTIWIDSIANAEKLSLSGKIATRFANRVYTQWPNLATDKIHFKGNVLS